MKFSFPQILLITLLLGCIDPLELDVDVEVKLLIVEGGIDTNFGPHTIALSTSAKFGSVFDGFVAPVKKAIVFVRGQNGTNTFLIEVEDGIYETPTSFKGEVGSAYSINIKTRNGGHYISIPEKIVAVPAIESLTFEFSSIAKPKSGSKSGIIVSSNFRDPENEQNFYKWDYEGTFKFIAFPELYTDPETGQPAPKPCCKECWFSETNTKTVSILSDRNVNGGMISTPVAFIEDDGLRFHDKYLVRIKQQSLSKEAYEFFKILDSQLSISGDIFDPPPATIRGNISSINNPEEEVIGFFTAKDISVDAIFLLRSDLDDHQRMAVIHNDCRVKIGATAKRPVYWE